MGILQFNSKKNENRNEIIENKSVAEIIIYHFEKIGVSHVFGIPGGFISPFLKLLRKSKKFLLL